MLLGVPAFFIGLYGVVGLVTGDKIVAGALGAVWAYATVVGAYELNRRKFDWDRGRRQRDRHLLLGTFAVSTGLIISSAMDETMPALAIVPALSAILQANDDKEKKYFAAIHVVVLAVGLCVAIWIYTNGIIGKVMLERAETLP